LALPMLYLEAAGVQLGAFFRVTVQLEPVRQPVFLNFFINP